VVPSESNFVFFAVPDHADAHDLWQKFLDLDVLIRDVGVPGHLRMTVGLPAENDAFLAAADKIIGEYK
jgi:histidinol-phosphate aminotransferase